MSLINANIPVASAPISSVVKNVATSTVKSSVSAAVPKLSASGLSTSMALPALPTMPTLPALPSPALSIPKISLPFVGFGLPQIIMKGGAMFSSIVIPKLQLIVPKFSAGLTFNMGSIGGALSVLSEAKATIAQVQGAIAAAKAIIDQVQGEISTAKKAEEVMQQNQEDVYQIQADIISEEDFISHIQEEIYDAELFVSELQSLIDQMDAIVASMNEAKTDLITMEGSGSQYSSLQSSGSSVIEKTEVSGSTVFSTSSLIVPSPTQNVSTVVSPLIVNTPIVLNGPRNY
jgi:hypothetical protein